MPRRKIIPYNPELKELARELRKNMTLSEVLLWNELKNKSIGYDFDRQRPIANYIVDFFCKELDLVIEIDGDTHIYRTAEDDERQKNLEANGLHFLRFDDLEVKKNMNNVLKVIGDWIERREKEVLSSDEKKPTPGILQTGRNLKFGIENQDRKPTPGPSGEGNFKKIEMGNLNQEPTPNPSGEGNKNIEGNLEIGRYVSIPVSIGTVPLGGTNPIRIQSMTNTDTLDTKASVAQCIRIIEAGADYVRLTAQGVREAENMAIIKKELRKAGFETPLIADIHFNPLAAETAARLVEKVRINPGNYADKRASFIVSELSEKEYNEELERIHDRLRPLIKICRENKTAIRVGINHGSLSDRIMTRYGNTPRGMVVSALEFINIFRTEGFNDLVLSMKSSDTAVMIEATRLLVAAMQKENVAYPLHLGVTEAGEGEDGRIRSAAGIGTLLSQGIGDTIRVSLSEDPENEIPVARKLAEYFPRGSGTGDIQKLPVHSSEKLKIFNKIQGPLVVADLSGRTVNDDELYKQAGFNNEKISGELLKTDGSADLIIASQKPSLIANNAWVSVPHNLWIKKGGHDRIFPLFTMSSYPSSKTRSDITNLILVDNQYDAEELRGIDPDNSIVLFRFSPYEEKYSPDSFLKNASALNQGLSIILQPRFSEKNLEDLQIKAAALLGRYINDRNVAGISILNESDISYGEINRLCFSILQSTGTRITRTVYLSCPTCGRTKFNLQEAVKKVKAATGHLKGLKIAVMGCIVNGPGEMAGADYGYVGAAPGKVHIYKGTIAVLKNVDEKDATSELLRIIEDDLSA